MLEEIPILYEILWAAIGVALYIFSCRILNYSRAILLYKEASTRCLIMLATLNHDVDFILKTKYETMNQCDLSEEHVQAIKEMDKFALQHWKSDVILSLINCLPGRFQSVLGFSNWDQAMKKIDNFKRLSGR